MVNKILSQWRRLEKKVKKFNEKFPEAHIICIATINNTYQTVGDSCMEQNFANSSEVIDHYKDTLCGSTQQIFNSNQVSDEPVHDTLRDALTKHCLDMDMQEMRHLIGLVLTSPTAVSVRENKRKFFDNEDNCPVWWRATSIPFMSLNHPKPGQKRATIKEVYELVESLQDHYHIVPDPPNKISRTNFRSRFNYGATEQAVGNTTVQDVPDSAPEPPVGGTTVQDVPDFAPEPPVAGTTVTDVPDSDPGQAVGGACEVPFEEMETETINGSNVTDPLSIRRLQLMSLSNSVDSIPLNSVHLLRLLGAGNWQEMLILSEELKPRMPLIPSSLANEWDVPKLLDHDARYETILPESLGNRLCLSATADGNCIYNTFSTSIYGNERMASFLRLGSIVSIADSLIQYSKYITEEFGKDTCLWVAAVSGTEYSSPENVTIGELVEYTCQKELLLTAKQPYRDCIPEYDVLYGKVGQDYR